MTPQDTMLIMWAVDVSEASESVEGGVGVERLSCAGGLTRHRYGTVYTHIRDRVRDTDSGDGTDQASRHSVAVGPARINY
jgi:hypothetical protein